MGLGPDIWSRLDIRDSLDCCEQLWFWYNKSLIITQKEPPFFKMVVDFQGILTSLSTKAHVLLRVCNIPPPKKRQPWCVEDHIIGLEWEKTLAHQDSMFVGFTAFCGSNPSCSLVPSSPWKGYWYCLKRGGGSLVKLNKIWRTKNWSFFFYTPGFHYHSASWKMDPWFEDVTFHFRKCGAIPCYHQLGSLSHQKKKLGGGFKHFLFSPLFGEDSHFD